MSHPAIPAKDLARTNVSGRHTVTASSGPADASTDVQVLRDQVAEFAPGVRVPLAPFCGTIGTHPGELAIASPFPERDPA